jgi:hypothetical protein
MENKNEPQSEYEMYKAQYEKLKAKEDGEWKEKLHLLQQEYEALQRWKEEAKTLLNPIFEYAQDHPDMKIGGSMVEFVLNGCKEYDKLKGKCQTLSIKHRLIVLALEDGAKQNIALKEKADKMADLLQYIRINSRLSLFAKAEIDGLLSSYNTNQKENNG